MAMTPNLRKLVLTSHITTSVGLLGAVVGFLALALAGVTSQDPQMVHAAYPAMKLIAWFVVIPLAFAALFTGIIQSLGTTWGLFRHYWILAKLVLMLLAILVLLVQMNTIGLLAGIAGEVRLLAGELRGMQLRLVLHAGGGLLVLLVATTLAVYKPWGMTRYGALRKQQESIEDLT